MLLYYSLFSYYVVHLIGLFLIFFIADKVQEEVQNCDKIDKVV